MNFILYILAIMIVYDFSLHIYDTALHFKLTKHKHPLGMYKVMDYFGGRDQYKRATVYNIFWTTYWGIASILILIYLVLQ